MKRARRTAVAVVVLTILALVGYSFLRPMDRTVAALGASASYTEAGSRFGVTIGEPVAVAQEHLSAAGMTRSDPVVEKLLVADPFVCGGRRRQSDENVRLFNDNSWRHGLICLFERNGHVVALGWTFQPITLP